MSESSDPSGRPPIVDVLGGGDQREGQRSGHWLGAILALYGGLCAAPLVLRGTLGHDESVYALRARDLADGWQHLSGGYWSDYRAPGLPMLIAGAEMVLPDRPTTARLVVVALGAVVVVATWWLTRRMAGTVAAVGAAAALLMTSGFVLSSTMVLADIPGMAFSIVATVVLWWEVERRELRWSFVLVPLLALGATLARFGAPFTLAAGLGGVAVVSLPALVREGRWRIVVMMVGIGAVVAALSAVVLFTSLFTLGGDSPVHSNSQLIGSKGLTPATGFRDLRFQLNPWSEGSNLWSRPAAVLVGLGVLAAWAGALLGRVPQRAVIFGSIAGIVSLAGVVISVGLIVPNYLMLTLPYWALLAGVGWAWILASLASGESPVLGRLAWVLAAVVFGAQIPGVATDVRAGHRNNGVAYGRLAEASRATHDTLGDGCLVLSSYTPQVGYYSGCWVLAPGYQADEPVADMVERLVAEARRSGWDGTDTQMAMVVVERGKRQPTQEQLAAASAVFAERIIEIGLAGERTRHVWVDRLDPCVADASCP